VDLHDSILARSLELHAPAAVVTAVPIIQDPEGSGSGEEVNDYNGLVSNRNSFKIATQYQASERARCLFNLNI